MTTLDEAVAQMRANGMPPFPDGLPRVNTPGIVRYGPKKRAWYRLHELQGRNGRSYVAGAYGMWGSLDPTKVESDWSGMDEAERLRLQKQQEALEQREREKRERLAKAAALRARAQYRHALDRAPSAYLERKGVSADPRLKFLEDGTVLVPAVRYDEQPARMVALQKIAADGQKRFNRGAALSGAACRLGPPPTAEGPILIAEGVATGLSIRQALGEGAPPLYAAFSANNLEPVARVVRGLYPNARLVICADDDWRTVCERHKAEGVSEAVPLDADRPSWCRCNPGRTYAAQAAERLEGVEVVVPQFPPDHAREPKHTDFNDLHQVIGLEPLAEQLRGSIFRAEASPAPTKGAGGKKKPKDPDRGRFKRALEEWTFIYGTNTVYVAPIERIVTVANLRLAEGKGFVDWWLDSEERRTVLERDVVFEPAGCQAHQLNLYRGMPHKPDGSKACARVLELLQFLCGEEGQDQAPLTDWVLRWCALPLQRPGAKMRTAIVMHGADEGTGKNLFWSAIRDLYGPMGGIVTQSELESQFNGWASQKLFLVANEVVSRLELRHQTGRLKNLITEPEISINEKMLPLRTEGNHINFVFLSNETQPMILGHHDRRYCVIHTPSAKPREFYRAIAAELAAGGALGLYAYLLGLSLDGFDEFTPPPFTEAKAALIELGMNSALQFATQWLDGALDHPVGCASSGDLYQAYRRWCARNGERLPLTLTRFSGELRGFRGLQRVVKRVLSGPAQTVRQATVFLIQPPTGHLDDAAVRAQVSEFADSLRAAGPEGDA